MDKIECDLYNYLSGKEEYSQLFKERLFDDPTGFDAVLKKFSKVMYSKGGDMNVAAL